MESPGHSDTEMEPSSEAQDMLRHLRSKMNDRSAIQKKTFTKWINTYLIKVGQSVDDLYIDLADGNKLITLIEILTGDRLPRERGRMRFHKLQNVETALHFLKRKDIRLVNIRNDDIVDGNPKLILGLIWTIILNFEISHDPEGQASAKATLIDWAKRATRGYNGVDVRNFTTSFKNGMAFNAIIHRFRPDIIDYENLVPENAEDNLENAFSVAEEQLGIPRLLDVEDFILDELDEKSIMTYLSAFNRMYSKVPTEEELAVKVYSDRINVDAKKILNWLKSNIDKFEKKVYKMDPEVFEKYKADLEKLEGEEMLEKRELKDYLADCYKNLEVAEAEDMITTDITMDKIDKFWNLLEKSLAEKMSAVNAEAERIRAQDELAERIKVRAEQAALKLDQIKKMIKDPPPDADLVALIQEAKLLLYNSNMEEDTRSMYSGVSALVRENHPRADDLGKEVQLISDELDEIKVRLDTLHNNLEQSAIDNIDDEINRLLAQIRAMDEDVKNDGYGEDLPSAHKVLDKLLVTMDTVDSLQGEVDAVKRAVADNSRCGPRQEGKLGDLEYAYNQLKGNFINKGQDMREGVEFLESLSELKEWGNEAKEKEVVFDWSEYHPKSHPYEKLLAQDISKHQKQFDKNLTLGKQLMKTEHPMSHVIGEDLEELCDLWSCLKDLAGVAEKHMQHHNDYELFWKRLNSANMWIKQKRNLLDTRYNAKCLDVVSSSERLQELVEMKKDIYSYEPNINEISSLGKVVINLSKRKKPESGDRLKALCPFKRKGTHELISQDEEVQYLSTPAPDLWSVKKGQAPSPCKLNGHSSLALNGPNSTGLVAEAPSCIFSAVPPDLECLTESDKTKCDYHDLTSLYGQQRGYLKHLMVKHEFFSNCDVVLTWPYDKNFDVELRGRELVISNLKEAGAGLILDAGKHPNSDKKEITAQQSAALDHWESLLDKHRHKASALSDLEKLLQDLETDERDVVKRCEEIDVTPDNVIQADKKLDKLLKDIGAIFEYLDHLEQRIGEESDDHTAEEFLPLANKLKKVKLRLGAVAETAEDKCKKAEKLITLQEMVQSVIVALENISDTLSDMQLYPLEVDVVKEDVKKLQLLSEELGAEEDKMGEVQDIIEELKEELLEHPLIDEVLNLTEKKDVIRKEIDDRIEVLKSDSEPGINQYETLVARGLHWLEDAEGKLIDEETEPSLRDKYQLITALKSEVSLKGPLFDNLKAAQESVISTSDFYEGLLDKYSSQYPISSPSKDHTTATAKSLVSKEGDSVQENFTKIREDVAKLLIL